MFSEISGAESHEIDFAQSGDLGERLPHEVEIAFLKVASAKAAFRRTVSGTPTKTRFGRSSQESSPSTAGDGLIFDTGEPTASEISEDQIYGGKRLRTTA